MDTTDIPLLGEGFEFNSNLVTIDSEDGMDRNTLELLENNQGVHDMSKGYEQQEELDNKLFQGVLSKNIDIVKTALSKGANINSVNNDGETVLMLLSGYRIYNQDIFAYLLKQPSINLDARCNLGSSALSLSQNSDRNDITKDLIEAGADVNIPMNGGQSALMMCARKGDIQMAQLVINKGGDINATAMNGNTASMIAASQGHTEFVAALQAHNERLDKIAEYIETLAIDKQSLFFAQGEKDQFMKDVTNFNKDNIISALTDRLVEKEISKQLESKILRNDPATIEEARESIKEEQLNKAKNAVEASIKTCKDEIPKPRTAKDATSKTTALQEGGSNVRNGKKLLNNDTSAVIGSFLSNKDLEEARIAFAKRPITADAPPPPPVESVSASVATAMPPAPPLTTEEVMRQARIIKLDATQAEVGPNDHRKPAASPPSSSRQGGHSL